MEETGAWIHRTEGEAKPSYYAVQREYAQWVIIQEGGISLVCRKYYCHAMR